MVGVAYLEEKEKKTKGARGIRLYSSVLFANQTQNGHVKSDRLNTRSNTYWAMAYGIINISIKRGCSKETEEERLFCATVLRALTSTPI